MLVAGVDEAGRGPLAGPVISAAVIFNPTQPIEHLRDSKLLTAAGRDRLFAEICSRALAFGIGCASVEEIDRLNILQATLLSMKRAVEALSVRPDKILIDGNQCPVFGVETKSIIRGDRLIPEISAASILAKVTRDKEMQRIDTFYPDYGFAQHKGYPTAAHCAALNKIGPCAVHRHSFAPVKHAFAIHNGERTK